ncbi:cysteine export CydDC family ABC transporter permease subunit/ATP-binding protein CydD [Rheinheimera sp. A13L]|uniref:thiol reductant ABC exporter subunit CydD n=1 Tax=Rheinheimera sp. A13L TaxID=506534 RepID=UPI0002124E5D|nr:thiol reductant ABC exporter subunit CydD [Rheinheimera sp. A13L]EGM79210.1 cysteine export CydDC family ABC transporter permease subunit/ATP-binding protein CydD [Rheinheimera sp. A13L]
MQSLRQLVQSEKSRLHLAIALGATASLLMIWQCWLLATLCDLALHQQQIPPGLLLHILLLWLLRPLLLAAKDLLGLAASQKLRTSIRHQLLGIISQAGPLRQRIAADGDLSTRLLEQVDALDPYISRYYPQLYLVVLCPLFISVAVASQSLLAAILLLATAPLIPLFMILLGRKAAEASQQQVQALGLLGGRFLEFLRGAVLIRQLRAEPLVLNRLNNASEEYRNRTMSVLSKAFLSGAVLELFASLAIALVALYLGLGLLGELPWAKAQIPVSYQPALFILLMAPEFYAPLRQLGADYHAKAQAEAAFMSLTPIWDLPVCNGGDTQAPTKPVSIEFQHLSLLGSEHRAALLNDIQLQVQPQQRIGIIGPSGAGKTSLLESLLAFQQPNQGQIWIAEHKLTELDLTQWRQQLVYLSQQSQWLSGTVRSNLLLAKPQATEQELQQVLQQALCADFVFALPQALDTKLTEGGIGLSGGQFQRLALARALLKQSWLWLLDEPASMLPVEQQRQYFQQLELLSRGKTLLLATHQLQHLQWLDQVWLMHEGQIIAKGSVAEIQAHPQYQASYRQEFV